MIRKFRNWHMIIVTSGREGHDNISMPLNVYTHTKYMTTAAIIRTLRNLWPLYDIQSEMECWNLKPWASKRERIRSGERIRLLHTLSICVLSCPVEFCQNNNNKTRVLWPKMECTSLQAHEPATSAIYRYRMFIICPQYSRWLTFVRHLFPEYNTIFFLISIYWNDCLDFRRSEWCGCRRNSSA